MKAKANSKGASPAKLTTKDKKTDKKTEPEPAKIDPPPEIQKPEIKETSKEISKDSKEIQKPLPSKSPKPSHKPLSTRVSSLASLRNSLILVSKQNKQSLINNKRVYNIFDKK